MVHMTRCLPLNGKVLGPQSAGGKIHAHFAVLLVLRPGSHNESVMQVDCLCQNGRPSTSQKALLYLNILNFSTSRKHPLEGGI